MDIIVKEVELSKYEPIGTEYHFYYGEKVVPVVIEIGESDKGIQDILKVVADKLGVDEPRFIKNELHHFDYFT